jgi:hypothetical protein
MRLFPMLSVQRWRLTEKRLLFANILCFYQTCAKTRPRKSSKIAPIGESFNFPMQTYASYAQQGAVVYLTLVDFGYIAFVENPCELSESKIEQVSHLQDSWRLIERSTSLLGSRPLKRFPNLGSMVFMNKNQGMDWALRTCEIATTSLTLHFKYLLSK